MNFLYKIFGWPLGWVMWLCYKLTNNYGLALVLFTIIMQMLMLPLTIKSKRSMAQQSALQPYTARLQEQYANNREKMAEEQQNIYKATGVSMASGCITPLIQFPILFGLIDVVYRPLTHIARLGSDVISKTLGIAETLGATMTKGQEELFLIPAVKNNPSAFSSLGNDVVSKIQGIDMTFFGIDLSLVPEKVFSVLGIFIFASAILSLAQILVTQYITKKSAPEGAPTMGAGMNITMILMGPVMSFFIGRSFPVGVTLYWSVRYIVTIIQEVVIDVISPQKNIVEAYSKEFDEKIKNRNKKPKKIRKIEVENKEGEIVEKTMNQKEYQSHKLAEARRKMDERYGFTTTATDDEKTLEKKKNNKAQDEDNKESTEKKEN